MSSEPTTKTPNPLPIHDANAELQRQSVHALHAVTAPIGLILRNTMFMDYGVDAKLEIIANQRATNFTSDVQIKATNCAEENQDGSISKQIDVSNLNYLLNGSCPLYLFYCATRKRFWYAWALEEFRRLESENPKWLEQSSVTIRFSAQLTDSALKEIHARIIAESQLRREITEAVARHSTREPAKFAVDPQNFKLHTGEEAFRMIVENGFTLVTAGRWREVLSGVDLLPTHQREEPRVRLVVAYAYYAQGRFFHAMANCGEASVRASELSRADQEVLDMIRNACECHMGTISRDEYTRRQVTAATAPNASLQSQIEATRFQLLAERNLPHRSNLLQKFRSLANKVISDPSNSEPFKLQTRIHLAYVEGFESHMTIIQSVSRFRAQIAMDQPWAKPDLRPLAEAATIRAHWEQQVQQLLRDTAASSIPWLHAEALRTALLVRTALLGFQRFQAMFVGATEKPTRKNMEQLFADAARVVEWFASAGHIEGELRAKLATADLHEIVDELEDAKKIATEVKKIAGTLGLGEIVRIADLNLAGTTPLQTLEANIRKDRQIDEDFHRAALSDAEVDVYAEEAFASSQLPRDRFPVIRRDVEAMRLASAERLHWCRHIELIQELSHTFHPSTAYASPTKWVGKCYKHRYESIQPSTDLADAVTRFKKSFCDGCPDRSPKVQSPKN